MTKYSLSIALICLGVSGAPAQDLSTLGVSNLVKDCADALESGEKQKAADLAIELNSRSKFHLGTDSRFLGMRCLKAHYGENFFFDANKGAFYSETMEKRLINDAREIAELKQKLQSDYTEALVSACFDEYDIDKFRALTTPACAKIFRTIGLPIDQ